MGQGDPLLRSLTVEEGRRAKVAETNCKTSGAVYLASTSYALTFRQRNHEVAEDT
jgi:hypothetical protein